MSGLKNTVKRLGNASMGRGYKTNKEIREERKMKRQQALDKIYEGAEMPDEQELRRKARRKAAAQRGSRVSTILTDEETLG
jgi:hypothetical protein